MSKNFLEAVKHRRSYYSITNESPVSDTEIENIINTVVKYGPSAFNSQSARVVLLLGDKHRRFWEIVKDVLKAQIGEERFPATGEKIDRMFASGYGTVLFYEDWSVVEGLQKQYPAYAANMPIQGTEADLMKQAMIAVDKALPEGANLILQIHDSLIVECDESQADIVESILRDKMENITDKLPVKLAVDVSRGKDWSEL